jgi:hypothetical protein
MAELVERIGGVGDELAEKDFRMGVERVDDQVEQFTDFGLKFAFRHMVLLSTNLRRMGVAGGLYSAR